MNRHAPTFDTAAFTAEELAAAPTCGPTELPDCVPGGCGGLVVDAEGVAKVAPTVTDEVVDYLGTQRSMILWCMHVLGPDDLHAASSHAAAEKMVNDMIDLLQRDVPTGDALCLPIVAPWPYSAKQHTATLSNGETP